MTDHKTVTVDQNKAFVELADDVRTEVAQLLVRRLTGAKDAGERDAVLSGALAGAAQVLWHARKPGEPLDRVLDYWRFGGQTFLMQFAADEEMGEPEGGKQ